METPIKMDDLGVPLFSETPETDSSHLKMDGKGILSRFLLGVRPIFRCELSVSFREGNPYKWKGRLHPQ